MSNKQSIGLELTVEDGCVKMEFNRGKTILTITSYKVSEFDIPDLFSYLHYQFDKLDKERRDKKLAAKI